MQAHRMQAHRRITLAALCALIVSLALATKPTATLAHPGRSAATSTTTINNVVIFMLENHNFTSYFGQFPGVQSGITLPEASNPLEYDLNHSGAGFAAAVDGGNMDEFPSRGYIQYAQSDIPTWWHYAQQFGLADNFYSSLATNSAPNHVALVAAGQNGGVWDTVNTNGCGSVQNQMVLSRNAASNEYWSYPCYNISSVPQLLSDNGLSWRYYSGTQVFDAPSYIQSLYASPDDSHNPRQFSTDVSTGALAAVSWVVPPGGYTDHPPSPLQAAQNWVSQQINLLMQSSYWAHTAIFISWDDWGGMYDPVYPPQLDGLGLGARVPLLVISPYAKAGYISHQLGEFSSFAKFIETNWSLPNLGQRDALGSISNLMDFFDFTQPPQPPLLLSPIPFQSGLTIPFGAIAPMKSLFGAVTPLVGGTSNLYTYSIIYSLSGTPAVHNVTIDGTAFPMTSKGAVTDGVLYQYATKLGVGTHAFTFTFSVSASSQLTLPYNAVQFPGPEVHPFTVGIPSVPKVVLQGQQVTYSVRYSSPQNLAPVLSEVDIGGVRFPMTTTGTNFKAGVTYTYSTNTLSPGTHYYQLRFDDGSGVATYAGSELPSVAPLTLTGSTVSPSSGSSTTVFTFATTYTDAAGTAPTQATLYVDQQAHALSYISGSMSTGALYQAQLTLAPGSHTFDFVFSDSTSSWADPLAPAVYKGPTVSTTSSGVSSGSAGAKGAPATTPATSPPIIVPSHDDDPDYPIPGDGGS